MCTVLLSKSVGQNLQDFGRDKNGQVNKTYDSIVSNMYMGSYRAFFFYYVLHSEKGYPISLLMAKTAPPCLSRDPGDHAL